MEARQYLESNNQLMQKSAIDQEQRIFRLELQVINNEEAVVKFKGKYEEFNIEQDYGNGSLE